MQKNYGIKDFWRNYNGEKCGYNTLKDRVLTHPGYKWKDLIVPNIDRENLKQKYIFLAKNIKENNSNFDKYYLKRLEESKKESKVFLGQLNRFKDQLKKDSLNEGQKFVALSTLIKLGINHEEYLTNIQDWSQEIYNFLKDFDAKKIDNVIAKNYGYFTGRFKHEEKKLDDWIEGANEELEKYDRLISSQNGQIENFVNLTNEHIENLKKDIAEIKGVSNANFETWNSNFGRINELEATNKTYKIILTGILLILLIILIILFFHA